MLVLSLCQKDCPDKIPENLSTKLGDGADGEVFSLDHEDDKVVKLSVLFEYWDTNLPLEFSRIESVVNYIKEHQPCVFARVYAFAKLAESQRLIFYGEFQNYIIYSYVMEKCFPISEDEKKVFHSIISHEDNGIKKNYSEPVIKEMLAGMRRGLDFDEERVIFFYLNLKKSPVQHLDLHVRNIMKDANGNFKLIDFDRSTLENLNA